MCTSPKTWARWAHEQHTVCTRVPTQMYACTSKNCAHRSPAHTMHPYVPGGEMVGVPNAQKRLQLTGAQVDDVAMLRRAEPMEHVGGMAANVLGDLDAPTKGNVSTMCVCTSFADFDAVTRKTRAFSQTARLIMRVGSYAPPMHLCARKECCALATKTHYTLAKPFDPPLLHPSTRTKKVTRENTTLWP